MPQITVTKASGEKEPFDMGKIVSSMRRIGIPPSLENQVISHVESILYPDISTFEIYKRVREFLKNVYPQIIPRFNLKEAIMQLGPSGYPFESYFSQILIAHGYQTEVGVFMPGKCVTHEVDILAQKDQKKFMIECKYHNLAGARCDIKIALYVNARFEDLKAPHQFDEGWLVTNTKCTTDAIQYATCINLKIVSWGYPVKDNLQNLIQSQRLFPITCQTTLTKIQKQKLLSKNIVLCKQLLNLDPSIMAELNLSPQKQYRVEEEVKALIN